MVTLVVSAGLRLAAIATNQLVIVGRNKLLKNLKYDGQLAQKLSQVGVEANVFGNAISRLQQNSATLPLNFNFVKIVSVADDVSRHNCPANSNAIYKELKGLTPEAGSKVLYFYQEMAPSCVKSMNIVLYSEYAHVFASYAAIARSFPIYSRKTSSDKLFEQVNVEIVVVDEEKNLSEEDLKFLQNVGESIQLCSRLVDMPCNELHTEAFADAATQLVNSTGIAGIQKTLIKDEDLRLQGFGGIYNVGKAAVYPPLFLCFSYTPVGATEAYALVGKGIVFDTGGMQIKGKTSMPSMKMDMGGAAAVLGAFTALVRSGFTQNLHCLLCVAENNISPEALKPDDIITMLSGKTVEVNNTDAEGRLVLADGVFYAKNVLKVNTIIDVATLTGAQRYASGKIHGAILANTEAIEAQCLEAGRKSGDLVHPLPFAPDLHFSDLKSTLADMKNTNLSAGGQSGPPSSIAGLFIGAHIDFGKPEGSSAETNWLHVDIAAPALVDERGTGFGIPLVCALLGQHVPNTDVAN